MDRGTVAGISPGETAWMTGQPPTGLEYDDEMDIAERLAAIARVEGMLDRTIEQASRIEEQLDRAIEQITRVDENVRRAIDHVSRINGRLSRLEEWRVEVEKSEAYERGIAKGREGVIITRSHLAVLAGASGGLTVVAQVIFKVFA